jgi:DNA-binding MarR family transcriptional regulator
VARRRRLDWERIARAEVQPLRLAVLEAMLGEPPDDDPGWTTKAVAAALGVAIENVSYHVRTLAKSGLIEEIGVRHRRAAIQRLYVLAALSS